MEHAHTSFKVGEVVHMVEWHEAPVFAGLSRTTIVLESVRTGVRGALDEIVTMAQSPVHVGVLGKIGRRGHQTICSRLG